MIPNNRKALFPKPQKLVDNRQEWHRLAREADRGGIKDTIYKGTFTQNGVERHAVTEQLLEIYHDKCAYCETKEFAPDVEHYRPKKGVTEAANHPGYYWLCYEWSNLIPACHFCNARKGKKNQFPLIAENNRVGLPSFLQNGDLDEAACQAQNPPLIDEMPFLFNPEIDDPSPHFQFDTNGKIEGIDSESRAEKTIEICDLNRQNLLYRRQTLLDQLVTPLKDIIFSFLEGNRTEAVLRDDFKMAFKRLESKTLPQAEYSLMATYIFKNFEEMVVELMETDTQKAVVRDGFAAYLDERENE